MGHRRRIGILCLEDESWAGGFYYVLNVIKSFNYLREAEKPSLVVFLASDKYRSVILETNYKYLQFVPLHPVLSKNKSLVNRIFRRNVFLPTEYKTNFVD